MMNNNYAAVMLIIQNGLILSISRRNNKSKFGLIGGKLNELEFPKEAAIRETLEESKIIVSSCEEIYVRNETSGLLGDKHFITHCFYAIQWSGTPTSSEEGELKWLTSEDLISPISGAFPDYNSQTLKIFKEKYPNITLL